MYPSLLPPASLTCLPSLLAAGFRKILKKFDKVTECDLQKKYMSTVLSQSYPFRDETQKKLDEALQSIIPLYARVMTRGDANEALRQLRIQLREHVVWERNTIWRDMIGLERKGWSGAGTGLNARRASLGGGTGLDKPILLQKELEGPDEQVQVLSTPLGKFRLPSWLTKEAVGGIIAVAAFIGILCSNFGDRVEERNCLAILVFASIFWALEVSYSPLVLYFKANYSRYLFPLGHSAICNLSSCTFPYRGSTSPNINRWRSSSIDRSRSLQIHLLANVHWYNRPARRRLHPGWCSIEAEHRQDLSIQSPVSCWYASGCRPIGIYGRCLLRLYVDQQCRCSSTLLFAHPANSSNSSSALDLFESTRSGHCPRFKSWRYGIANRKSPESDRYLVHVRAALLGSMVRHCAAGSLRLNFPDLDSAHLDVRLGQIDYHQSS